VDPAQIIVDSKSGVSGAGRTKMTLMTHFAEINDSVQAYGVAQHRHQPEMDQELSTWGSTARVTFTPHLIPMTRGILTTAYAQLKPEVDPARVEAAYRDFYAEEPFVTVLPSGKQPQTKAVSGSNRCHVGLVVEEGARLLIATSAIDNLVKGLSGAAVQCLNLMQGWPETTALERSALWP
jgi:N-acetyl-gamma-glutamyl-phosphate reductase